MSNYESGYGSDPVWPRVLGSVAVSVLLVSTFMAIGRSSENKRGDQRVERVQVAYEYIETELERTRTVHGLRLVDEAHTFSFQSPTEGTCHGMYEQSGEHGEAVQIIGDLACTTTVPR
jgi:hypothetical protein